MLQISTVHASLNWCKAIYVICQCITLVDFCIGEFVFVFVCSGISKSLNLQWEMLVTSCASCSHLHLTMKHYSCSIISANCICVGIYKVRLAIIFIWIILVISFQPIVFVYLCVCNFICNFICMCISNCILPWSPSPDHTLILHSSQPLLQATPSWWLNGFFS